MIQPVLLLGDQLNLLEQAALLRRAENVIELEYLFKHGLVQETAYDSLLRNDRRRLHRFVAETLEQDALSSDADAPVLALHWDNASEPERALPYYLRAGQSAARRYANSEALMAYDRVLELARDFALSPAQAHSLFAERGRVLELQSDFETALLNYQQQEEWAIQHQAAALELDALIRRTTLYAQPSDLLDFEQGVELSKRALERVRATGDRVSEAKVLWNLLLSHFFAGQNDIAVEFGERSVAIARELNLREQLAYSLNDIARSYIFVGRSEDGMAAMQEAQTLWRDLNNSPMLADNLIGMGMASYFAGDYVSPIALVEEGLRIGQEIGNVWGQSYAEEVLGMLYLQSGELDQALQHSFKAVELGTTVNFLDAEVTGLEMVALTYQQLGVPEEAVRLLDTLDLKPNMPEIWISLSSALRAMMQVDLGHLDIAPSAFERKSADQGSSLSFEMLAVGMAKSYVLLAEHQSEAALAEAGSVVAELDANRIRPFRPVLLFIQSLALEQMGQLAGAVETAEAAHLDATKTSSRTWLWQIQAALARLYTAQGRAERALQTKREGRAVLEFMFKHIPPEYSHSFRNRPPVQDLLRT